MITIVAPYINHIIQGPISHIHVNTLHLSYLMHHKPMT